MASLQAFRPIVWTMALGVLHSGALLGQVESERRDWLPDEPITVRLVDERRVEGLLDHRTNASHLWLRGKLDGAELASRHPWSSIVEVFQGSLRVSNNELLSAAKEQPPGGGFTAIESVQEASATSQLIADNAVAVATYAIPADSIQSLQIEARLANWDADAIADGFLVTVYPTTAAGASAPVRGNLDLWLLGEVWPRPESPYRYPRPGFQELARASHLVREVDFSRGPATFRLPLRHLHPEAMQSIATYGIVHARLGVNGQGVFEAADSFVRLREASPTRDRLQLYQGQRFYPIERPPRLP